jgi:flavorubredoxin
METTTARARVTEIAPGIHQFTIHVPEMDFGFNQYLVAGEEPLLFHTGMRHHFPLVRDAIAGVVPVDSLRWISFGHVEADECGAMNQFLAVAPNATVAQGQIACMVSLTDLADRPPRPLATGEVIEIGGHRIRWIDTPHLPHSWEAGVMYDETTRTLLCGDLFTRFGAYDAVAETDIAEPAIEAEVADSWSSWALRPDAARLAQALADLPIDTIAPMHNSAFRGDCRKALLALAAGLAAASDGLSAR